MVLAGDTQPGRSYVWSPYTTNWATAPSEYVRKTFSDLYWDEDGADYLNSAYWNLMKVHYTHEHNDKYEVTFSANGWYATDFLDPCYDRDDDQEPGEPGYGLYEEVEITWGANDGYQPYPETYYTHFGWSAPSGHSSGMCRVEAELSVWTWWLPEEEYGAIDFDYLEYKTIPSYYTGGCPFVYTWNGTQYVIDNNLITASENPNRTKLDVEDYYKLDQPLVPKDGKYSLMISEFENEHSYFDQVRLLAVDHASDIKIAVTPDGEIITYKKPVTPISCIDNYGNDRLSEISVVDGNVSDPTTYFYGEPGDYLILNFGQVSSSYAKLIMREDMIKKLECIEVQVVDKDGNWKTVATVLPRAYWATDAVNLSPYLVEGQDLSVRLFWKNPHRLDYVGLDTTKQAYIDIHYANLVSAIHSTHGNMKPDLMKNDGNYAELIPGEQIRLLFSQPKNTSDARDFVIYADGYYVKIADINIATSLEAGRSFDDSIIGSFIRRDVNSEREVYVYILKKESSSTIEADVFLTISSIHEMNYHKQLMYDFVKKLQAVGLSKVFTVITFNKPITFDEYDEFVQRHNIDASAFEARAIDINNNIHTIGGVPLEDGAFPREELRKWTPADTVSIGVTSIEGMIDLDNYSVIANDGLAFLVDITPTIVALEVEDLGLNMHLVDINLNDVYWTAESLKMLMHTN